MVADGNREVRRDMARAVRRLNIIEYFILAAAAAMSLGGGALVALLLNELTGASFRVSWLVSSLLLFILPGIFVFRRESRRNPSRIPADNPQDEANG